MCSRGQYRHAGDVLRDADTAMFRAKAAGRTRVELFHNNMHVEAVERMELEMDLRRAIERHELQLAFQPIVRTTGAVDGHEALLRWQHPTRGLVMPGTFIPIAEETSVIVSLGEWVLDRVCRMIRENAFGAATVNVNVSAVQLQQADFVERTENALRKHRVDPRRVRLEVTESAIAANPDAAAHALRALRASGLQLCIDDFGIGYSSLASLLHMPFTTLKIDRSLITGLGTSHEHREMVAAITTLARNLGLEIVAEGVENAAQLALVEELGIDLVQGYFTGRPAEWPSPRFWERSLNYKRAEVNDHGSMEQPRS